MARPKRLFTVKYELPKGFYITNLDALNWIVAQDVTDKNGKTTMEIDGYYGTLPLALRGALQMLSCVASNHEGLVDIVMKIETLSEHLLTVHRKHAGKYSPTMDTL